MISPWSPLLPSDHPDYYPSYFTWIPSPVIATQHITLPQLAKLAENSSQLWTSGTKAFWSGFAAAKQLVGGAIRDLTVPQPGGMHAPSRPGSKSTAASPSPSADTLVERHIKPPMPEVNDLANVPVDSAPMVVQGVRYRSGSPSDEKEDALEAEGEIKHGPETEEEVVFEGDGLWGKLPCCISCTTTEYMQAESFSGIGQEHLVCLNRGPSDTGYKHLESAIDRLAEVLRSRKVPSNSTTAQNTGTDAPTGESKEALDALDVRIWWGWQDTMVPRKGQLWFIRNITRYPDEIDVHVRDVQDGDHTDLLSRAEGIYEVYAMIRARQRGEPLPEPND